jgi:hypothetical protein
MISAQPKHRLGDRAQGAVQGLVAAPAGLDPSPDPANFCDDGGLLALVLAVQNLELPLYFGELPLDRIDLAANVARTALTPAGFVVSEHGIVSG